MDSISDKLAAVREAAESDLLSYIRLVDKTRVLGHVHEDLIRWWERRDAKSHQMVLLPRDHMKSALVGFRVAWRIAKDPTLRVLYASSTSGLAEKQLGFIKQILSSDVHQRYWPDLIHPDEGKRERWTVDEICVDHPSRRENLVRDPTVKAVGMNTSTTGLHCDILVFDDTVVFENAYSKDGRTKVATQCSLLSSVAGAESEVWVVGTRYFPTDQYNTFLEMMEDVYNEDGEIVDEEPVYEIFERKVESSGDGTGTFLWPRQQRYDGKWFGFDAKILAKKRAQYTDRRQYRAQYYNDPSDPDNKIIDYDKFNYYDNALLKVDHGTWFYAGQRLNLCASIDFAFSTTKRADFTAIVVIGINADNDIFVLDIARFKTEKISDYYKELLRLLNRWSFRKLRAETTVAQKAIVRELKESYIKPNGLALTVIDSSPTRYDGSKEERINAILEPRYDLGSIFHGRGGNFQVLEDELVSSTGHDDVKDALAMAIEIAVKPSRDFASNSLRDNNKVAYHPRFGGRAF